MGIIVGVYIGISLVLLVVYAVKGLFWLGNVEARLKSLEQSTLRVGGRIDRIYNILVKGQTNDNTTMVGSKPAGPA